MMRTRPMAEAITLTPARPARLGTRAAIARRGAVLMATEILDPAVLAALLGVLAAGAAAIRFGRFSEAENDLRPWAARGWPRGLTAAQQQEARARAAHVARLTMGEEAWSTFVRDGYIELPSAAEPGRCYRLRSARRVEIRPGALATIGTQDPGWTRAYMYLCVYPTYELPAVEFLAQLYVRLRDDERCVPATGRLQHSDGPIPNVF